MKSQVLERKKNEKRWKDAQKSRKLSYAQWLGILILVFLGGGVFQVSGVFAQGGNCAQYCVYIESVDASQLPKIVLQLRIWDATTGMPPADISEFSYQVEADGEKSARVRGEQLPANPVYINFVINATEQDRTQVRQMVDALLQTFRIGIGESANTAAIWYLEKDEVQGSQYSNDQGRLLNAIDLIPFSAMGEIDLKNTLRQISTRTAMEKPIANPLRRMMQEPRHVIILLASDWRNNWTELAEETKSEFMFTQVIFVRENEPAIANCKSINQLLDCSNANDIRKDANSLKDKVDSLGSHYRISFSMPSFYRDAKKNQIGTLFVYGDKSQIDPEATYRFPVFNQTATGNHLAVEYLLLDTFILLVIFLFLWSALRLAWLWDTNPRAALIALIAILLAVCIALMWGTNVNQDFERTVIYAFVQNVTVPTETLVPTPTRPTSTRVPSRVSTQTPTSTPSVTFTITETEEPTTTESPSVIMISTPSKTPKPFLPSPTPPPLGGEQRCVKGIQEISKPHDLTDLPLQTEVLSIEGIAGPIPQTYDKYELDVLHAGQTEWLHVTTGFQTVPNNTAGKQLGILLIYDINRPKPWLEPGWYVLRLRLIKNANYPGGSCFSRFRILP